MSWRVRLTLVIVTAAALGPASVRADEDCPQPVRADYGYRLRYDGGGALLSSCAAVLQQILAAAPAASDILVFAHGWKNDPVSAESTYTRFISGMTARRPATVGNAFRPLFVGIFWPSATFPLGHDDEESLAGARIDSNAALEAKIRATFDWLEGVPGVDLDIRDVARLVRLELEGGRRTRADFLLLANILKRWGFFAGETPGADGDLEAPGERKLFALDPQDLAQFFLDNSYAAGGEESFSSRVASVLSVLNTFTFWKMKRRAGEVGESGIYELVKVVRVANPAARIHLIGHSFGGKLVLAAVTGKRGVTPNTVDSVVVIQGALSHFALSTEAAIRDLGIVSGDLREGRYAAGITTARSVHGPVVVVFSKRDQANGFLYPLGVQVSGDALEKRERKPPIYGAMGANGAVRVDVQKFKLSRGAAPGLGRPPEFTVLNVDATDVIPGHSKIYSNELYDLIWAMLRAD